MFKKISNKFLASLVHKIYKIFWFIFRPNTNGVKVIIFNEQNNILMIKLTYYPNTWTFVGGKVNKNESPEKAILRECKEEIGIDLEKIDFVANLNFNHEYKKDVVYIYKTKIKNTNFKINEREISEFGWFELGSLPNMGDNAKRILETVLGQ